MQEKLGKLFCIIFILFFFLKRSGIDQKIYEKKTLQNNIRITKYKQEDLPKKIGSNLINIDNNVFMGYGDQQEFTLIEDFEKKKFTLTNGVMTITGDLE